MRRKFFNFLAGIGMFVFVSATFIGITLAGFGLTPWSTKEAATVAMGGMVFMGICTALAGEGSGFDGSYRGDGGDF